MANFESLSSPDCFESQRDLFIPKAMISSCWVPPLCSAVHLHCFFPCFYPRLCSIWKGVPKSKARLPWLQVRCCAVAVKAPPPGDTVMFSGTKTKRIRLYKGSKVLTVEQQKESNNFTVLKKNKQIWWDKHWRKKTLQGCFKIRDSFKLVNVCLIMR